LISSPQNAFIKRLVALRKDGNARQAEGAFLIEGRRAVRDALAGRLQARNLIISENLLDPDAAAELEAAAAARGVPVVLVSKDCFRKIADVQTPQGAAAEMAIPRWIPDEIFSASSGLFAAAFGLQDPGNLGTIIRAAHAAGAAAVLASRPAVDPYNSKVVRSAAASIAAVPIVVMDESEALECLARHKVRLVLADTRAEKNYTDGCYDRPCCIGVGSEAHGSSIAVQSAATESVRIPMAAGVDSLNAAVTASLMLYEAIRKVR
jgi:RNA methyltransferase, TrmH family